MNLDIPAEPSTMPRDPPSRSARKIGAARRWSGAPRRRGVALVAAFWILVVIVLSARVALFDGINAGGAGPNPGEQAALSRRLH